MKLPLVNYYSNINVFFVLRAAVAPTTTSSISCYSCVESSRENCAAYKAVVTCSVENVCRLLVHKWSPIVGGAIITFAKGCFSKSACSESDQCNSLTGGYCWRCCDSNLCNNGGLKDFNTGKKTQSLKIFTVDGILIIFCVFLSLYRLYIRKYTKLVTELYISLLIETVR